MRRGLAFFSCAVAACAIACSLVTDLSDIGSADAGDAGDATIDQGPPANCVLAVVPTLVRIAPGSSAKITVNVTRNNGFSGPVVINVNHMPTGVSFQPLTISSASVMDTFDLNVTSTPAVPPQAIDLEVAGSSGATSCISATMTLAVPGVLATFVKSGASTFAVPKTTYLASLELVMWGSGGGGAYGSGFDGCSFGGSGGGGAFLRTDVAIVSAEMLTINIGGGGGIGGLGGGCTDVMRGTTLLALVPAGGGGGQGGNKKNSCTSGGDCRGGTGGAGGAKGATGDYLSIGGEGGGVGTSSAGGVGGATGGSPGVSMGGGKGGTGGGSGGCGFFGGGGGGAGMAVSPDTGGGGGGGGGSAFYPPDSGTFTPGNQSVPPNTTDPNYDPDAGAGQAGAGGWPNGIIGYMQPTGGHSGRVVVIIP